MLAQRAPHTKHRTHAHARVDMRGPSRSLPVRAAGGNDGENTHREQLMNYYRADMDERGGSSPFTKILQRTIEENRPSPQHSPWQVDQDIIEVQSTRCVRCLASDAWSYFSISMMGFYGFIVLLDWWHPLISTVPGYYSIMLWLNIGFLSFFIVELLIDLCLLQGGLYKASCFLLFELASTCAALALVLLAGELRRIRDEWGGMDTVASLLPKVVWIARLARIFGFLRIIRHAIMRTNAAQVLSCLSGRVPARGVAQFMALLVVIAGITMLITGLINTYEVEQVSFLRVSVPALADNHLTSTGEWMLFIGFTCWTCAYCSTRSGMTWAVLMLSAASMFIVTARVFVHEGIDDWRTATAAGEDSIFSDAGLKKMLALAEATEHDDPARLRDNWVSMRANFEHSWSHCGGTVFNSSRVIATCVEADRLIQSADVPASPPPLFPPHSPFPPPPQPPLSPPPLPLPPAWPWDFQGTMEVTWSGWIGTIDAARKTIVERAMDTVAALRRFWMLETTSIEDFDWRHAGQNATAVLHSLHPQKMEEQAVRAVSHFIDAFGSAVPSCQSSEYNSNECLPRHSASCAQLPLHTGVVLYCGGEYLDIHKYSSPWHVGAGRYDALATSYCLDDPTVEALAVRMRSDEFQKCTSSQWWQSSEATPGNPIELKPAAADADPNAVFAALGAGDHAMDGKMLFCLCMSSPKYRRMMYAYSGSRMYDIAFLLILLGLAPCVACCLFAFGPGVECIYYQLCPSWIVGHDRSRRAANFPRLEDSSIYYDQELL